MSCGTVGIGLLPIAGDASQFDRSGDGRLLIMNPSPLIHL